MAQGYTVDELAQALISRGGYNSTDAYSAANNAGGRADELAREFLGKGPLVGGGGGGASSFLANLPSAEEVANGVIQAVIESLPELPKVSETPFAFDEELAREASTAEFSPFYQEQLDDFIQDVETKRQRGGAEERRLLEDLTIERDIGAAERGLTFSGERKRELGEEITPTTASPVGFIRDLQRRARDVKVGTKDLLTDLTKEAFRGEREIGRAKTAAIESGVLQRRGEALESYLSGLETQEEGAFLAQPLGVLGTIVP
ncbi:MAG: hypothetical protein [Podoviridae sp. ctg2L5]|nr:MAG: hypothetical protein [Podoviridae sp. ctg2L5]